MTTVITYGNFDLFHIGHVRVLQRARSLGSRLVVGVSTDEFSLIDKGKQCVVPFDQRIEIVRSCRYVDSAFPELSWDQKVSDISRWGADIFVIGDDWVGKFDYLTTLCGIRVVYLERTPKVSSTLIRQSLGKMLDRNE